VSLLFVTDEKPIFQKFFVELKDRFIALSFLDNFLVCLISGDWYMKILKGTSQFALLCILMLSAYAFAQEPVQDLQDSLTADSLQKISLASDVDTSDAVDTNKVEYIGTGIRATDQLINDYFPDGFIVEFAYAAPAVVHLSLWRFRLKDDHMIPRWFRKHGILLGFPAVSLDVDEGGISDEGVLSLILFFLCLQQSDNVMNTMITLNYLMFGDTYFPLSDNGRFGIFEKHRILDYALYDWGCDKPWEFGFSEALGLRFVLSKIFRRSSGYYVDFGAHVRITNQRSRYGIFVQLGSFSSSK